MSLKIVKSVFVCIKVRSLSLAFTGNSSVPSESPAPFSLIWRNRCIVFESHERTRCQWHSYCACISKLLDLLMNLITGEFTCRRFSIWTDSDKVILENCPCASETGLSVDGQHFWTFSVWARFIQVWLGFHFYCYIEQREPRIRTQLICLIIAYWLPCKRWSCCCFRVVLQLFSNAYRLRSCMTSMHSSRTFFRRRSAAVC